MATLRTLCVYCGSNAGTDPVFTELARALGRCCAEAGVGIVFGGGRVGLMGQLAEAALASGGRVVGIMPEHLRRLEVGYEEVSELVVVESMHARKALMAERSDAFCVLPGGVGTLDEMIEIITWKQLRLHDKPIVLLDQGGFWQPLLRLFAHQREAGFLRPAHLGLFDVVDSLDGVFEAIARHPEPTIETRAGRV